MNKFIITSYTFSLLVSDRSNDVHMNILSIVNLCACECMHGMSGLVCAHKALNRSPEQRKQTQSAVFTAFSPRTHYYKRRLLTRKSRQNV